MNKILRYIFLGIFSALLASCVKQLDKDAPNSLSIEQTYKDEAGYKQVLAKIYGGMAATGNSGPAGSPDVRGVDEGASDFFRSFWYMQEMTTDMAKWIYNDQGGSLYDLQWMKWNSSNEFVKGLYGRSMFVITLSNEFLNESSAEKLTARGITGAAAASVKQMRAEVRFVRAFQYWVLMEIYANPGFATEENAIGVKYNPRQTNRTELLTFIEKEMAAIEPDLPAPKANEYGRVDKAACWSLLARMYLNTEVYIGQPKWTEAMANAKKVIDAGYSLIPDYRWLMLADNHLNKSEFIWTFNYDGIKTQSYGGATFIINGASGGPINATLTGLGGWGAMRTTKNVTDLFADISGNDDKRAQFYTSGFTPEMNDFYKFTDGIGVIKYRNLTRSGALGSDPGKQFADVDIPVFRLAEMYLIYAEAALRANNTTGIAQGLQYLNMLRRRAYMVNDASKDIGSYNLQYILDERGRELYWEGFRRTDLIRYNRFTQAAYVWPWKGNVRNGSGVESYRVIFPLPSTEIAANPNLKQNDNY